VWRARLEHDRLKSELLTLREHPGEPQLVRLAPPDQRDVDCCDGVAGCVGAVADDVAALARRRLGISPNGRPVGRRRDSSAKVRRPPGVALTDPRPAPAPTAGSAGGSPRAPHHEPATFPSNRAATPTATTSPPPDQKQPPLQPRLLASVVRVAGTLRMPLGARGGASRAPRCSTEVAPRRGSRSS